MTHAPTHDSGLERAGSSPSPRHITRLIAASSDLMLTAQLETPARLTGVELEVAATPPELAVALTGEPPTLALIDAADIAFPFQETYDLIRRLAPGVTCIAIYPHVRADLRDLAQAAGCDLVLPRSRFFSDIAASLRAALARPVPDTTVTGDSR
jgi:hypothetical protein